MATQAGPSVRPRTPLNRQRVLVAAIALADLAGIDSLSMRKLGQELGVEAMSLYNHVANKDDLLDGMVDLVFAEIEIPDGADEWKAAMRRRAISARDALLRHPWAVGLMQSRATPGPATLRHHDAVLGTLRAAGFTVVMAAHAYSLMDSYIYGFALQQMTLTYERSEQAEDVAQTFLARFPVAEYPHLAEMVTDHAMKPGYEYAREFEFGLDLILDGLERLG